MRRIGLGSLAAIALLTAMLAACNKGDGPEGQPASPTRSDRVSIREAEVYAAQLRAQVEMYAVIHGRLPETLEALTEATEHGPITQEVREDPWGAPYEYRPQDEQTFQLFSRGPDGQAGSDDDVHAPE
jgi:hypothetical protein